MHQKSLIYIIFFNILFISVSAKKNDTDNRLSVSLIPDSLKTNAHAVIRNDQTTLNIKSLDNIEYNHKYAITILSPEGKQYANFFDSYSLLSKINKIKGRLLDENGVEIKSLKEKDVYDRSIYGLTYTFHSDYRFKEYNFNHNKYPYTVEYEINKTIKTTFFIPDWQIQKNNDCSVENSELILKFPQRIPIRHKEYLMPGNTISKTVEEDSLIVKSWIVTNLSAYIEQPLATIGNNNGPVIILASNTFELLKHKGSMQSWKDIGMFNYKLNEGRDGLPEDKKAVVKSLLKEEVDIYARIQKLYSYMQQTTRYVANEFGIAGWQTFDAVNVAKNGYGDCKGLTNYLKALLKEAGINSHAALINAGPANYYRLDEQFPCNTFNHVILCVPLEKDSIWIECTSPQLLAGYLGSFTQGRLALLTTEEGGFLCKTPSYGKNKSYTTRKAIWQLVPSSKQQKITLQNKYHGLMQDDLESFLKTQPNNKIKDLVNTKFPFASYNVSSYDYKHTKDQLIPAIEENVELIASGLVSGTQKRTFVNMAWMNNPMTEISQSTPRTAPFVLNKSFQITDSVLIDLPEGLEIESTPQPVTLSYPFAEYHIKFEKSGNKAWLIRRFEQNEGIFDAADFEKYQQMYRTINSGKDNLNIVFLNKTS